MRSFLLLLLGDGDRKLLCSGLGEVNDETPNDGNVRC